MTRWSSKSALFVLHSQSLSYLLSLMLHTAQNTNIQLFSIAVSLLPSHSHSFLFFKDFCFSHTPAASFLPCTRQRLFNSGRPDVHLITALPSRTRAENSLKLFSQEAMARGAKYTPIDIKTHNHCSDSLLSSLPVLSVPPTTLSQ